jgi:hypothetical protein
MVKFADIVRPAWWQRLALPALLVIVTALLQGIVQPLPVSSQSPWSRPENISRSPDRPSFSPRIVADHGGGVHVFWEENVAHDVTLDSGDAVLYSFKAGNTWSAPVDILAAPSGDMIQLGGVAVSPADEISIVWSGDSELFYSTAPAARASDVHAWKTVTLDPESGGWPDICVDSAGTAHVVWTDGLTVWYVSKARGSDRWSAPVSVWTAPGDRRLLGLRVVVDHGSVIHVTWTEYSQATNWESAGVWYGRSADGGVTWSGFIFESDRGAWSNLAIDAAGYVHQVWEHGVWSSQGRWHRLSVDGGLAWSRPQIMFHPGPVNGLTRWPLLALDSANALHYISPFNTVVLNGQRSDGGILHSEWSGGRWVNTEVIPGAEGEFADLAISDGNRMNVVYHNVSRDNLEIWYTSRLVNAPQAVAAARPLSQTAALAPDVAAGASVSGPLTSTAALQAGTQPVNKALPESDSLPVVAIASLALPSLLIAILLGFWVLLRRVQSR